LVNSLSLRIPSQRLVLDYYLYSEIWRGHCRKKASLVSLKLFFYDALKHVRRVDILGRKGERT